MYMCTKIQKVSMFQVKCGLLPTQTLNCPRRRTIKNAAKDFSTTGRQRCDQPRIIQVDERGPGLESDLCGYNAW